MSAIWRVFKYVKYYPKEVVLNLLSNLLYVVFNLFSFVLIVPFVELLFGMTTPPESMPVLAFDQKSLTDWLMWNLYHFKDLYGVWTCLFVVSGGYLLATLLSCTFRYLAMFFLTPLRNGIVQRMRDDVYHKMTILPVSYFNSRRRGDILSRMSNDLADIEWSVVSSIQSVAKDPINIILFSGTLLFVSARLFLYFLLIGPAIIFFIAVVGKSLKRNSMKGQVKLGTIFSVLEESLSGMRVIKSFGRERDTQQRFSHVNDDFAHTSVKVAARKELGGPLSEVLGTIGLVAVLILGGMLVIQGEMHSSVFIFFVIIFARLLPPVHSTVQAYNNLQKGNASAERFWEIIDADETILEKPDAIVKEEFLHDIEYRDVSFAYVPDNNENPVYVLDKVNLKVEKGMTVAIVGPSGAGKTTLVDLLPRFYDCVSGEILIDGISIKDLNINSLRKLFGIVSQNCILFNDTVANNIAFGRSDYSLERVQEAAHVAHADEFIQQLPQGYSTTIGDRGLNLSGGQRQRISIARAVLKDPPILILDEATSALDSESQKVVQEALDALMQHRTAIVIAHRLSTIRNADLILVMEQGRIVESGTHESLCQQEGVYKKLLDMQSFS